MCLNFDQGLNHLLSKLPASGGVVRGPEIALISGQTALASVKKSVWVIGMGLGRSPELTLQHCRNMR